MAIRKLLTAAMLTTGVAAFAAGSAHATAISGSIDVSGVETAHTATSITFRTFGGIDVTSGSFNELGTCPSSPQSASCVTLAGSLTSPPVPGLQLFTATNNGDTVTLDVTSDVFTALAHGGLQITGTGIVSLTGFTDSAASFSLTVPGKGAASFDIQTVVPEPGTLALFGAGLLGCALFVGRRRRSTKAL